MANEILQMLNPSRAEIEMVQNNIPNQFGGLFGPSIGCLRN